MGNNINSIKYWKGTRIFRTNFCYFIFSEKTLMVFLSWTNSSNESHSERPVFPYLQECENLSCQGNWSEFQMNTVIVLSQGMIFTSCRRGIKLVCSWFIDSLLQICQILRLPWAWFVVTEGEHFLTLIDSVDSWAIPWTSHHLAPPSVDMMPVFLLGPPLRHLPSPCTVQWSDKIDCHLKFE